MVTLLRLTLAWSNLTLHKGRFLASTAGIAFAVFLMFMELGFLHALFDSQLSWLRQLNADLVMTSKAKWAIEFNEPFPRSRLVQARAVPGVVAAYPLYVERESSLWRNPEDRTQHPIRVLAFNPEDPVFLLPEVLAQASELSKENTVLIDVRSKDCYGRRETGVVTDLAGRATRVAGTFRLGLDFLSDGNVIMSDRNFAKYFAPERDLTAAPERVELGLIRITPAAEPRAVAAGLRSALPDDVTVLTKQELLDQERRYWEVMTPFGTIFGLGMTMGFAVGVIICYQVLFTEVTDHEAQFATMKAIGHTNRAVIEVVLAETLILSLLGFGAGALVSVAVYAVAAEVSGLPMHFAPGRAALVFVLTVAMCVAAGLLAVRRVAAANPAEVFG